MCSCNLVAPRLSAAARAATPAAWGEVRRHPPGLVAGQLLGRRSPTRLVLEIDVGERLPVGVPDDKAPPIQLGVGPRRRTRGGRKWRGRLGSGAPRALAYCAFGFSDGLGAGAEPVGAAFFFFFFFFGASLGCWASGCWASAFEAVSTAAGTAKLAARPTRRNSFRREIT